MNVQKRLIQPMNQKMSHKSYESGMPNMYIRVEKEKERLKKIKKFTKKSELKIINKYWILLKRFYSYRKFIKNQKQKLASIAFEILKYNYLTNYQKYGEIIEQFDLRKKAMIFYMLKDEHIIEAKKRFMIKQRLISSFNTFLNNTRNAIENKYNNYSITQKFYFNIFVNKVLTLSKENDRITQNIAIVTNFQMNNAYCSIIRYLKRENYIKNRLITVPITRGYLDFFEQIKGIISQKNETIKKIFDFRLKYGYKTFNAQIKNSFKERNKIAFVDQFYEEKLQRKAISKIKAHLLIINNFRRLITNKLLYEKEKLIENTGIEVNKKNSIIQKYREYRQNKIIPIKKSFFENAKKIIEHNKMNIYAKEFAEKTLKKKIFIELGKYAVKNKSFKIFLIKFQKIYRLNIKRDYIHLMQYKVHKFINQNGQLDYLPHSVGYYISQKFNNQLINLKIFEMASFIKKCKKIIINKKKEKNKILAANIFYSKLLKIKVFDNLSIYYKYIQVEKRYQNNIKNRYLNILKKSLILSQKERQYRDNIRKIRGKNINQKFFIGLIIGEGVDIYNHRKVTMRNIIINQILKNEELNNDTKRKLTNSYEYKKINSANNKLATIILFKLLVFIIYRKLFNKLKLILLTSKYKNTIKRKYLKFLKQASINQNFIKTKMDKIKDDILNININK